jgi:stage II sporulation protein M
VRDYFPSLQPAAEPSPLWTKRILTYYARQVAFIKRMKCFIGIAAALFSLVFVAGLVFFKRNPDLTARMMSDLRAEFGRRYPGHISRGSMFFSIWINNLRIAGTMCLAGLIPFFLPSAFWVITNAGALGLVLAYSWIRHEAVVQRFSTLILPHGIVEIPTFVFTAGFSLYLSAQMTKRVFHRKRALPAPSGELFSYVGQGGASDRLEAFGDIIQIFAGVILPLVLIAAIIETFFTPLIYRLFG